ncbi:MAG: MBL fold metallo-hydrolase [Thermodesulfobacteriota bacterium]
MNKVTSRLRDLDDSARLESAGLARLVQPMPFGPESVNVYLGLGPPPFLIDTGLPSARGASWLAEALAARGLRLADVGHVFLTHAHLDHAGAVQELSARHGAMVWAHPGEAPRLDGRQVVFLEKHLPALLRWCGLAPDFLDRFLASLEKPASGYKQLVLDRFQPLTPGMRLPVSGLDLEVVHTPGHSGGSVCFLERGRGLLFTGDTLLAQGPPRALISPSGEDTVPFDGLLALERSLAVLEQIGPAVVLGGHGPPAPFPQAAAQARRSFQARRQAVLGALAPGRTVFDLIRDKAGGPPVAFLMAVGETRATLEALLAEKRIRREERDGVERFFPLVFQPDDSTFRLEPRR